MIDQERYMVFGTTEEGGDWFAITNPGTREQSVAFAEAYWTHYASIAVIRVTLHWPSILPDARAEDHVYYRGYV